MEAPVDVCEHTFKGENYSENGKNKKFSNQTYELCKIVQYLVTTAMKNWALTCMNLLFLVAYTYAVGYEWTCRCLM